VQAFNSTSVDKDFLLNYTSLPLFLSENDPNNVELNMRGRSFLFRQPLLDETNRCAPIPLDPMIHGARPVIAVQSVSIKQIKESLLRKENLLQEYSNKLSFENERLKKQKLP